ncbi:hypothetical protein Tco_1424876, partial [Tanacetum coccineum]
SDDLYPVTNPLTTLAAFLSTNASTWHQHLGHPGDEVLHSLVSRWKALDDGDGVIDKLSFGAKVLAMKVLGLIVQYGVSVGMDTVF